MKAVVFAVAVCGAAQAAELPQRVSITASEAARPEGSELHYQVQCKQHRYLLTINYHQDTVTFSTDGKLVPSSLDGTPLGKALKSRPLFGHWGFACPKDGLFMEFVGFNIANAGAPEPVGIRGNISADGKVDQGSSLDPVPLDKLRHLWGNTPAK
jgi:hypothetical protein